MKILVTGGCGFIGSNFIKYILDKNDFVQIINVDKQTYAGKGNNFFHMNIQHRIYKDYNVDISNKEAIDTIFQTEKPEIVINFAAESHVDKSIQGSNDFIMSNIVGTTNLLEASKNYGVKKFIQISTDEVYGSREKGSFDEDDKLNPSSPYSSSKASAELIALSYFKTHGLPVIITRSANNYGPYQYPEKLVPFFITNLIDNKKIPLMWSPENPGLNVRDWLHVEDNCAAIYYVLMKGEIGEIYNIPGNKEKTNAYITSVLLKEFNMGEEMIEHVTHRKGHDFRYSIKGTKLKKLGFKYKHCRLEKELPKVIDWYKNNQTWWRLLKK